MILSMYILKSVSVKFLKGLVKKKEKGLNFCGNWFNNEEAGVERTEFILDVKHTIVQ